MNRTVPAKLRALEQKVIAAGTPVAVAVSGGVDSMTLAAVVGRLLGNEAQMYHAVSSAVPLHAARRVDAHAARQEWNLRKIDAREIHDPEYQRNPVNRCFYCKSNLYRRIRADTDATILSGTNLDDLGDYRPGLAAAEHYGVRHPFVEAGIDKANVRSIARFLELLDLSELPASPCLSSRVETGIEIHASILKRIDEAERLVSSEVKSDAVRCRVRKSAIVIELDQRCLATLSKKRRTGIASRVARIFHAMDRRLPVRFSSYRMGSAFLRAPGP